MWKTLDELLQCESALQRVPEQTHHTEKSSLRAKNHFFQRKSIPNSILNDKTSWDSEEKPFCSELSRTSAVAICRSRLQRAFPAPRSRTAAPRGETQRRTRTAPPRGVRGAQRPAEPSGGHSAAGGASLLLQTKLNPEADSSPHPIPGGAEKFRGAGLRVSPYPHELIPRSHATDAGLEPIRYGRDPRDPAAPQPG